MSTSGVSFSGLFSNLDTDSIISQLMYIEAAPVRLLEQKQTKLDLEKTELQNVNNNLLTLRSSLEAFLGGGVASTNKVTSSDESIVTGTANSGASEGDYAVEVLSLADEQIVASDSKFSSWTMGGASPQRFFIDVENGTGTRFTIDAQNGDTLTDVAQRVNSATNGAENFTDYGMAQIINDPTTGQQTMVIKPNDEGVANQFAYSQMGGKDPLGRLGIWDALSNLNELQSAADASVSIDGVTVSSSTNQIDGALYGVTLDLNQAAAGTIVDVSVGVDEDDIVQAASDFVTQFNATTEMLNGYVRTEPLDEPSSQSELAVGILFGDSDLSNTKSDIRLRTTGYVDSTNTDYILMSQIGITSEAMVGSTVSSTLEFDEQKFRDALSDNRGEVTTLMENWADQLDEYLEAQTKVSVVQTDAGNYYRRMLSIDKQVDNITDNIADWDERLLSVEETMRAKFTAMEEALQRMQSQGDYLTSQLSSLMNASGSSK